MEGASKRVRRPAVHRGVELRCGLRFEEEARAIVAEVARDALVRDLDREHPGYHLARTRGYGSGEHREALRRPGPSSVHRRTFRGTEACLFT